MTSFSESEEGLTLSEAQGLTGPGSGRAPQERKAVHIPRAAPTATATSTLACAWCGEEFTRHRAAGTKDPADEIFQCGGGCEAHYLCNPACSVADWTLGGHARVCRANGK